MKASERRTEVTEITREQYLMLVGLRTLNDELVKQQRSLEKAALAITGETAEFGLTVDYLYGSRELDELLKILGIKVAGLETANAD